MKEFFKVTDLDTVLEWPSRFPRVEIETLPIQTCFGRILGSDIVSDVNLPDFSRSIMDGFAVRASSTFGASEGNPAYLNVSHTIPMGESPDFSIGPGEAAKIATGPRVPTVWSWLNMPMPLMTRRLKCTAVWRRVRIS
jgi:molybdopterin molybdotransferase